MIRIVITVLGKVLDRNYTLLRNVTPPGLGASFPFILVGPAGVLVMYVTPLNGLFRAKGDQWAFLIIMFVISCLLITAFLFMVIRDQSSFVLSLLP